MIWGFRSELKVVLQSGGDMIFGLGFGVWSSSSVDGLLLGFETLGPHFNWTGEIRNKSRWLRFEEVT